MAIYAVMNGNVVENMVVAEDPGFFIIAYPDNVVIEPNDETGPAFVGATFENGKFIPPQPYPSWIFDQNVWQWDPPKPYPADGKPYYWVEETLKWKLAE